MWNFIHDAATPTDIELLFGPIEKDDILYRMDDNFTLTDAAVMMGIFPSKTQARKNGWEGFFPLGYQEHRRGKRVFWSYIPVPLPEPVEGDEYEY